MTAAAAAEKREMYKVVLVGNFQVGKTSIFYRMKNNTYPPPQDVTGIDRCVCNVEGQGKTLQLSLWDTAGVEQYKRTLTTNHYRYANIAVCVYDVTRADTFDNLKDWLEDATLYGPENIAFILCGNKVDKLLEDDDTEREDVSATMVQSLRNSVNFSSHILTSAKEGKLDSLKEEIAKLLLAQKNEKPHDTIDTEQRRRESSCC